MPVDFTKFPFATIVRPEAPTLTEAIAHDPVGTGFVVITLKSKDSASMTVAVRTFADLLRSQAADSGLVAVTAYRQILREELGGAMPFDQPVCVSILEEASKGGGQIGVRASETVLENPRLDWLVLLEFGAPEMASKAAAAFNSGSDDGFKTLQSAGQNVTVGAFKNMRRYSSVSEDPNVVQFFNLFDAPGDLDTLWSSWQDALPWFFEIAEFRSSFPLLALDPKQPVLLVNRAHLDSTKHFLNGALHDPTLANVVATDYAQRGVTLPDPFFCKMVPV